MIFIRQTSCYRYADALFSKTTIFPTSDPIFHQFQNRNSTFFTHPVHVRVYFFTPVNAGLSLVHDWLLTFFRLPGWSLRIFFVFFHHREWKMTIPTYITFNFKIRFCNFYPAFCALLSFFSRCILGSLTEHSSRLFVCPSVRPYVRCLYLFVCFCATPPISFQG